MRILGVDPGSRATGWGIVELQGSSLSYVASGTIQSSEGELARRLCVIAEGLEAAISRFVPVCGAVESIFHARNSQSALKLGHARGAILLTMARKGLSLDEYSPTQIKQCIAGHGRATKEQVQEMVRFLLGSDVGKLGLDESDALAVALCHGNLQSTPTARMLRGLQREVKTPSHNRQRRGRG